jgi:hypothetical protein
MSGTGASLNMLTSVWLAAGVVHGSSVSSLFASASGAAALQA